jgi:hypothetical protein
MISFIKQLLSYSDYIIRQNLPKTEKAMLIFVMLIIYTERRNIFVID